jgi:LysR family transcriptional activator of glutamate synthase operon
VELRQLQYFVKVARKQHMTQASEELHVAQSAVSRQIHLLEEQLGAKLFMHKGRNLQLTPVGKLFLGRAEEILISLDKAVNEVHEFLDPEAGEIRFGFPNSLGINLVPKVVSKFHKEHPNVKFRFKQGMSSSLEEAVVKGQIDLALVTPLPEQHPHITGDVLLTEELFAILPPDHILAQSQTIRLEQLKDESFVLFSEGYSLRTIVWDACKQAGFTPKIGFEGEETDTIRGFVAAGMGVSLLPETALKDGSPLSTVKIRVTEPKVSRSVGIIRRSEEKLPLVAEVFRRFLLECPNL